MWIDSLYGSNHTNLPPIYDDPCIHTFQSDRADMTTTNDCRTSTLILSQSILTEKFNEPINITTKYSSTNVILPESDLDEIDILNSKLGKKNESKLTMSTDQQKNSIRRIRSDLNMLILNNETIESNLTESFSITNKNLISYLAYKLDAVKA